MLVLDTNTISYYFRGEPCVVAALEATTPEQVAVPAIVVYELQYGLRRLAPSQAKPRLQALAHFLQYVRVIPFDEQVAQIAAKVRVDLEKLGTPIGAHDVLIAATALSVHGQLVTRNIREFRRVTGLQCLNWFDT
ncbi:type II toxin-antitoxin system VapC family toxin [Alkanindiges sp. WGS2144]|uniref:type II toxin-antitoxin system VapC family toxin n=1 Tax=Alkanindiges sp. WGS2144 TaxID=3366808 RepID=UPI0037500012